MAKSVNREIGNRTEWHGTERYMGTERHWVIRDNMMCCDDVIWYDVILEMSKRNQTWLKCYIMQLNYAMLCYAMLCYANCINYIKVNRRLLDIICKALLGKRAIAHSLTTRARRFFCVHAVRGSWGFWRGPGTLEHNIWIRAKIRARIVVRLILGTVIWFRRGDR